MMSGLTAEVPMRSVAITAAPAVSAMTHWASSTPAAHNVATPAAAPPFIVRLSASTSRESGVSAAKPVCWTGKRSPHWRAGQRSTWMNLDCG